MRKLTKFKSTNFEGKVDLDNRIIREVVLIEPNREASGHDMYVDQKMVNQVVEFGQSGSDIGFKARFDHPDACFSSMGSQLGRLRNFKLKGNKAVADLHVGKFTEHSPNGDIGQWLLSVASEDPDLIGFSIVFEADESVTFEAGEDEDPDQPQFRYPHARIKTFHGADVVDQGAATSSLFEDGIMGRPNYLAEQAEHWLNDKSDLVKTIFTPLVKEMVTELNSNNTNKKQSKMSDNKKSFDEDAKSFFNKWFSKAEDTALKTGDAAPESNEELEAANAALAKKEAELESFKAELEAAKTQLTEASEANKEELSSIRADFEALKKESIGDVVEELATSNTTVALSKEAKDEKTQEAKEEDIARWGLEQAKGVSASKSYTNNKK